MGGEHVWGLQQGRDSGLRLGERSADTGCQCLPLSLCLTHPHELPSHIPFMLPPASLKLQALPPFPGSCCPCLALAYTENHSFTSMSVAHPHRCPGTHAAQHTHTHLLHRHSSCTLTHTQRPCRYAPVHTCTPTHASRELLIHVPTAQPLPSFSGQGHPWMPTPFMTPATSAPASCSHIWNARRHTHTLTGGVELPSHAHLP